MTAARFYKRLKTLKLPVAYAVFEKKTPLPFIIYEFDEEDGIHADNKQYFNITEGVVELYTPQKDIKLEQRLEKALTWKGLCFKRLGSAYIAEEHMQCTRWEIKLY